MQLCKARLRSGEVRVGVVADGRARLLPSGSLSRILHADQPAADAVALLGDARPVPLSDLTLLAPVEGQESLGGRRDVHAQPRGARA